MTIIALWLCFQGVGCRHFAGNYATVETCVADRDRFNRIARVGEMYVCMAQRSPRWEPVP
jgi:hypothetical protein